MVEAARLVAGAFIVLIVTGVCGARAEELPRYRLTVGDVLQYERMALVATSPTGAVQSRISERVEVLCLAQVAGRWLMLVDAVRIVDGRVEPARAIVFEIDARGARTISPALWREQVELEAALDALPVLQSSFDPGPEWETPADPLGRTWKCKTGDADPDRDGQTRISFERADATRVAELLGEIRFGRYWYDREGGIVTRAESEERSSSGQTTIQSKIKLRDRSRREAEWISVRAEEARAFVRAAENAARLEWELFRGDEGVELALSRIERAWSGLEADAGRGESPFRGIAAAARQRVAETGPRLRRDAMLARSWLGQPAVEWTLRDVNGAMIRSTEARARPRVELFWSSQTAEGLRALAAARRLQQPLKERGIELWCLSTEGAAARHAAETCGAGLQHVLAEELAGQLGVSGVPAVRWVDERGVVIRAFVGFSPDLSRVAP